MQQYTQLSFPVKTWSVRAGDVRIVSRLVTFGLPALAFFETTPHPTVDMREQFADLFTVLQVGAQPPLDGPLSAQANHAYAFIFFCY